MRVSLLTSNATEHSTMALSFHIDHSAGWLTHICAISSGLVCIIRHLIAPFSSPSPLQPVVSTGDEFLDEFLGNDASLDVDGAMPDIKVMDSGINMTGNEVSALWLPIGLTLSHSLPLRPTPADWPIVIERDQREWQRKHGLGRVGCTRPSFLCISKGEFKLYSNLWIFISIGIRCNLSLALYIPLSRSLFSVAITKVHRQIFRGEQSKLYCSHLRMAVGCREGEEGIAEMGNNFVRFLGATFWESR